MIILNGTLPGNALGEGPIISGNPFCWSLVVDDCPGVYKVTYPEVARVTASFGFNYTAPFGTLEPLTTLYIGVRENDGSDGPTSYSITATRLPRTLEDGLVLQTALPPCAGTNLEYCRQYFHVPMGGYDILRVHLLRTDGNLTYVASDGWVGTTGRGFTGALYSGSPGQILEPPPASLERVEVVTNTTSEVEILYFCTTAEQARRTAARLSAASRSLLARI